MASEASPLVKVGGLADVAGSLPRVLAAMGHDVRIALPGYGAIDWDTVRPTFRTAFPIGHRGGQQIAEIYETRLGRVPCYLVSGPPIPKDRRIYGDVASDAQAFVFLSLAALSLCRALDWKPDVLHAHDWHAGTAVYWLATSGRRLDFFRSIATLFTIHNLPYTGRGSGRALADYGLEPAAGLASLPAWARDAPLALGLASADLLSTVSPTYAREILTPAFGEGLDGVLRARAERLIGILNGIDPETWNPATDAAIASKYDSASLGRRRPNKAALQQELGLEGPEGTPLLAVVSRLDRQKGIRMSTGPVRGWLVEGGQFVLLGTGEREAEAEVAAIEREFPGRASVRLRFDGALARRIYAGADALLIPSLYEPCGLTQMIGMRYGAVPVARRTGGLADTVTDAGDPGGTGVLFDEFSPAALWDALTRARRVYAQPARWAELQTRGMRTDFSWSRSAGEYVSAYTRAVELRKEADPAAFGT